MALDREAALSWYRRNRDRSRRLFDMLPEHVYYSRPIALRHPIVFYEGHLPGFSFNTLVRRGLGQPSIDPHLPRRSHHDTRHPGPMIGPWHRAHLF